MTTNTTNSQAASIASKDFLYMLADYDRGDVTQQALIGYIDAKLAQARHEAWCEGVNIDALREENAELKCRATAAEAKLANVRISVEGLLQYILDHDWGGIPEPVPQIDALRALLQPQPQADESGLPG